VPALRPRARVVILQHPREAKNPMGTARMAHLALPGSELCIGIDFEHDARVQGLLAREAGRSVVLYPAPGARPVEELAGLGPLTLWVIDGTWWQASKIWQANPSLRALPAYRIDPEQPSRYLIRNEPASHCLSSVEAVAAALDASEGAPGRYQSMVRPLDVLVGRQLEHARSEQREPRRRSRAVRPPYMPALLLGRVERALVVHGEGNAWPAQPTGRPPTELVQWVASRPATGERFGVVVRPAAGVSALTETWVGLGAAEMAAAVGPGELLARWSAFVRPDDVWCAWGHVPARLLAAAGTRAAETVDLRSWTHRWLRARPGRIEVAHDKVEAAGAARPAPSFVGRGGHRLALLEAIFARLTAGPRR
jgi:DTW domain-containing protein